MKRMCTQFHDGYLASHRDDSTSESCLHVQLGSRISELRESQTTTYFV
jgi:hypothetical protein